MIKFGVLTPQQGFDYNAIRKIWLECERLGYYSAWLVDHFIPYDAPETPITAPNLECWTTLSALAAETSRLRLGPLVTCNSYRYPSVLAKISSTLDVISGGRLEFGIGAGWLESEYIKYGIPFPKTAIRMQQLREGIQIIKKMWTEERADFEGKYYRIKDAINNPKPLQKPHPKILIGAEGDKMLKIAAEFADVWNFPSDIHPYTLDEYKRKIKVLETHCSNLGRDPDEIEKSWLGIALIAENKHELRNKIQKFKPKTMPIEEYLRGIVGIPEECIEKIGKYVKAGVTYIITIFPDIKERKCLELFAEHVIPAFRNSS